MKKAREEPTQPHLKQDLQRRDARPEDAATIIAWFPTRRDAVWWGGPKVSNPLTADWLVGQFALGSYWVWTGPDNEIQAMAGLQAKEGGVAWLNRFGIAPAIRGKGLAAQLMNELIDIARRRGDTEVSLGVYGSNHIARRVYEKLGFKPVSERIADEDPSGTSITMRLAL
jgi:ribosomal protein S18 acetylase RimI-like enzyme